MLRSRITGLGFHVPPRVVTNHDLEKVMDTTDAWIVERTGIRERHFVEGDVGSSDLGIEAARKAIADAGRTPHWKKAIVTLKAGEKIELA